MLLFCFQLWRLHPQKAVPTGHQRPQQLQLQVQSCLQLTVWVLPSIHQWPNQTLANAVISFSGIPLHPWANHCSKKGKEGKRCAPEMRRYTKMKQLGHVLLKLEENLFCFPLGMFTDVVFLEIINHFKQNVSYPKYLNKLKRWEETASHPGPVMERPRYWVQHSRKNAW